MSYIYTNKHKISLALAAFLMYDDYDHDPRPNAISATTLLKPIRQLVLIQQNKQLKKTVDISEFAASSMGSALHDRCERAWTNLDNISKALTALGAPADAINMVKINPTKVNEGEISVYVEQRTEKELLGYIIPGKFDLILDGNLNDFKSTSVWGYIYDSNAENYTIQGSIYRWLNPDKVTNPNYININFIFTDWSKARARQDPRTYPQQRVITKQYPLWSIPATEEWITHRIKQYIDHANLPQAQLPRCTDKELWASETVHKYYKNPANTKRATKNFKEHEYQEALDRQASDGNVGIVKTIKGEVKACQYCPVVEVCDQAKELIQTGRLTL